MTGQPSDVADDDVERSREVVDLRAELADRRDLPGGSGSADPTGTGCC